MISSKTLNKGATILETKTQGIQNTQIKHDSIPEFWSSSPSSSSSSSSSSFLFSSLLRFCPSQNRDKNDFCLSHPLFILPYFSYLQLSPQAFKYCKSTCFISIMTHLYSFNNFHILFVNFNLTLILIPQFRVP